MSSFKASVVLGALGSQPVSITEPQALNPEETPPNHPIIPLRPGVHKENLGRSFSFRFATSANKPTMKRTLGNAFKSRYSLSVLVGQPRPAASFSSKKAKPVPPPANTAHISKLQNKHLSSLRSPDLLLPQSPSQHLEASAIKTQAKFYSKRKQEQVAKLVASEEPSASHR